MIFENIFQNLSGLFKTRVYKNQRNIKFKNHKLQKSAAMKKIKLFISVLIVLTVGLNSCKKDNLTTDGSDVLPVKFTVDLPSSISRDAAITKSSKDILQGNEIYTNLTTFIKIGETSADLTEKIMGGIRQYHLNHAMVFSFKSDDDNRVKNAEVLENTEFEGTVWRYQLNIIDAESVTNPDEGFGMQIFWNRSPVKGIAILKPYNINRTDNVNSPDAIFRIDYSEAGENGYDSQMTVSIGGLPLPAAEPYAINNLKMFAGKKGDIIEVYGNSNHPNATLFTTTDKGFNWAFVAAGSENENIATAEVGLPPSTLNTTDRNVILTDYSIKNVFTQRINDWALLNYGQTPTQTQLDILLANTQAPGFFSADGFVCAGNSPTPAYSPLLAAMSNLSPYNPFEISNLVIGFKTLTTK
jgi:hypothetical protein